MGKKVFMKGNEAIGEAAIRAGCAAYYCYPITPQNELVAYMAKNMPLRGRTFIQTESEICAINAVFGSSIAGFRAMTSSAGTAMSLKQEGISHMAYMEVPAVIVDMMRGGPGIGNIMATQCDYNQATKGGGTGDYHVIVLAPNSVQEAADFTSLAFELSEKYRNPVLLLGDGIIGQMMEQVEFKEEIDPKDLPPRDWALNGCKGREPRYIEPRNSAEDLEKHNLHLQEKYQKIIENEKRSEAIYTDDAEVLVVAFGTCSRIAYEFVAEGRKQDLKLGLFRPQTLWPFPGEALRASMKNAKAIVVIEMNAGMMVNDVALESRQKLPIFFHGRMGGSIVDGDEVFKQVKSILDGNFNEWGIGNGKGIWKTYKFE